MNKLMVSQKRLIILSAIMFCLAQAKWISFKAHDVKQDPVVNILSTNEDDCILNIDIAGATLKEYDATQFTDIGKEVFIFLSLGEYPYTGDIGKPKLPMLTNVLDVPYQAVTNVEILQADFLDIDLATIAGDKRIMPALASIPKIPNAKAKFVIDGSTYAQDAFYPEELARVVEYGGYARGHRLATLQIFPIQYNPIKKSIRCYTNIQVKVNFLGGNIVTTKQAIAKNYSRVWEDFIKKMVVNYPEYLKDVPTLPIYYDIFYNGAFSEAAESLAYWKSKKGYQVRKWDAAGWTASAIADTIEAQNPIATFLVVIGDPNSATPLPASGTGSATGGQTDLYYAETDGTGYLPDLFNARISVLNATQANIAVQRALRYEHANFGTAGNAWLKKAFFVAGYDPGSMTPFAMATNWYCRNLLIPYGYTVDTIACHSGEQETRIVDAINNGTAWCIYTAHGSETSWACGYSGTFTVSELTNQTNNLDMYPMPVGHCCLTGDYEYSVNCFGETWDRLEGKGGICYFGSVPSTYWDEDDWLQRRYFDAIYADSIPGHLYETGRFTQWGLYWIYNHTATSLKRYYFEAYHIFNDPSLDFWTDIPDSMLVTHDTLASGPGDFAVTVKDNDGVTPIENALVCCWIQNQNPEMHVSAYTDALGQANLNITPNGSGYMYVTVTKHNYYPYEGQASVGIQEEVGNQGLPIQTMLSKIFPNPFNQTINITFQISKPSDVELKIYDASGRIVRNLKDGMSDPGYYSVVWNGCDNAGHEVSEGIYFVSFAVNDQMDGRYNKIEKIIFLR